MPRLGKPIAVLMGTEFESPSTEDVECLYNRIKSLLLAIQHRRGPDVISGSGNTELGKLGDRISKRFWVACLVCKTLSSPVQTTRGSRVKSINTVSHFLTGLRSYCLVSFYLVSVSSHQGITKLLISFQQ